MNSKVYKWCAVPKCTNTSIKTPNKVFVYVPNNKTMRNKWLNLARRDPAIVSPNSSIYFCEDHFDLPNDMDNYIQYLVMGSVSQVRMKPGCVPTKFECQPDRRKRTSNTVQRPYILNKRRKRIVEESEKDDFSMSSTYASKIFMKNIPLIASLLRPFIVKLDKDSIKNKLPMAFRHKYHHVSCIIDCLEIEIQKPSKALNQ